MHTQSRDTSRRQRRLLVGAFLLFAAGGCAQEDESAGTTSSGDGTEVESEQGLLARVDREDRKLRFFEPEPGLIAIVESGLVGSRPMIGPDTEGLSPVEKYEFITGRPAPLALVRAQERDVTPPPNVTMTRPKDPTFSELDPLPYSQPIEKTPGNPTNLTGEEWWDIYGCRPINQGNGNHQYQECWPDVSGNGSRSYTDLRSFEIRAISTTGSIRVRGRTRRWYDWSSWATYELAAGEEIRFSWFGKNWDFDAQASIDQAEGDNWWGRVMGQDSGMTATW